MEPDLREIARRAVGRVLAERGERSHATAHPSGPALGGVHVHIESGGPQSASSAAPPGKRELVTVECLAETPDHGVLHVPRSALVTPLAREEAQRRGIRLQESAPPSTPPRHAKLLRVAVASDHGGFRLKRELLEWLREFGAEAVDLGTRDENPVDYPDFARAVAEAVAAGQVDLGVCIDGAGIGSAMAANKVPGVRAANCHDAAMAKNAREHNYANVLTLGARMIARDRAYEVVRTFLATKPGEERHGKRVEKIVDIERRYARGAGPGSDR